MPILFGRTEHRVVRDWRSVLGSMGIWCMVAFLLSAGPLRSEDSEGMAVYRAESTITRLTFSGSNWVGYPSLSDDGTVIAYLEEIRDTSFVPGKMYIKRMIKLIQSDGSGACLLFADSTVNGPEPYEETFYMVGTKPPLISGNGETVIFSLSLSSSEEMVDHYLGVVKSDGTGFRTVEFQNEALASVDWREEGLASGTWARLASYAISDDGQQIVCALKGHLGPVASGNPSGIVVMNADGSGQRTLLGPRFEGRQWTWEGFPRRPLTGGGWGFALSGDGGTVLFGAQSSEDGSDYDLYLMETRGGAPCCVTSFHDRLFTIADLSDDGQRITFHYAGKKMQGVGTYAGSSGGGPIEYVRPDAEDRIDYDDVTGTGDMIFYKTPRGAFAVDLRKNCTILLFEPGTPGHVRSGIDMDFPSYPSFWAPNLVSDDGQTVLLAGVPVGKDLAEVYLLRISEMNRARLYCPRCQQKMEPSWQYCPYDGTKLGPPQDH